MVNTHGFLLGLLSFSARILASPQITFEVKAVASQDPIIDLSPYLATETAYFSVDVSTTKWIGVNSVVVETITQMTAGYTSTITTAANIAVSTATAASDGTSVGDLIFIITPAGKALLHDIFTAAVQACGGAKLKSRQTAEAVASCAMRAVENTHPEIFAEIETALANGAVEAIGWSFYGIELASIIAAAEIAVSSAVIAIAIVNWLQVGKMALDGILNVIKIPASKISKTVKATSMQPSTASTTASTSAEEEVPLAKSPMYSLFMDYEPTTTFDTDSAAGLATYLRMGLVPLASIAVKTVEAAVTCTCTAYVSQGVLQQAYDCPLVADGERCTITTVTQSDAPSSTPPTTTTTVESISLSSDEPFPTEKQQPTLQPTAAPPTCNSARALANTLPPYIKSGDTFSPKAAIAKISTFCSTMSYYYNTQANVKCATQAHYMVGYTERHDIPVYFGMQWDKIACPLNPWWNEDFNGKYGGIMPGQNYVTDEAMKQQDCIDAFTTALTTCDPGKSTNGAKISHKCIEYTVFPSFDDNLSWACAQETL